MSPSTRSSHSGGNAFISSTEGLSAVILRGAVAGVLGALVSAIWFLIVDSIAGRPLFTPAALASALFFGARDPAMVEMGAGRIISYTVIHFSMFAAVGIGASLLLSRIRRHPRVILAGLLLASVIFALFIGLLAIVAEFLLGTLAWWSVAGGSIVAAVVMALFLSQMHPEAGEVTERDPFEES